TISDAGFTGKHKCISCLVEFLIPEQIAIKKKTSIPYTTKLRQIETEFSKDFSGQKIYVNLYNFLAIISLSVGGIFIGRQLKNISEGNIILSDLIQLAIVIITISLILFSTSHILRLLYSIALDLHIFGATKDIVYKSNSEIK
ncbi:hypothetical protein KAJ27_20355, partial [bacterium]|nr:hypothetical protein [bacterium]